MLRFQQRIVSVGGGKTQFSPDHLPIKTIRWVYILPSNQFNLTTYISTTSHTTLTIHLTIEKK